ncbi:unnamed protein product [Blepharisma stoltei]|uniref:Uncharacterized protein n=1 Tax=Blepharisma stoltei TaxID=1481888 RepID=A0AAU9IUN7_9CILI|nr:unnamed protein product [Blepharisma stoltei]
MESTHLTTSLSSNLLHFSSDFPLNNRSHTKQKLLENAMNKESFLWSNQEDSSRSLTNHSRSKSLNHNFNKIQISLSKAQKNYYQEKEKTPKKINQSPDLNKKKTHYKVNSVEIQQERKVNKSVEGIRSSADNFNRRKASLIWPNEEKVGFLSKNYSMAQNENQQRQKTVSSIKSKNIIDLNKSKNNHDWNEISGCIAYLLCEVDPKIKITNEKHMKKEMMLYFNDLNHVIQMLKKLPWFLKEKRISKTNITKSHQNFLKADLSKLPSNSKTPKIIKLLKSIFSSLKIEDHDKKELKGNGNNALQSKCDEDIKIITDPEKSLIESIEQKKEVENIVEIEVECINKQDALISAQTSELIDEKLFTLKVSNQAEENNEHIETDSSNFVPIQDSLSGDNPIKYLDECNETKASNQAEEIGEHIKTDSSNFLPIQDSLCGDNLLKCPYTYDEIKTSNQTEEIYEHIETDSSNFLSMQDSSNGDNPLKCPYIYYDESSFSSFEWSENFRSLSRLSSDSGASKSSLLQRFYQKSGYIAKEPQILSEILINPGIPPLISDNDTPNFSSKSKAEQSPIRKILIPSNKVSSASPIPYKSPAIKPKSVQITPRKNENCLDSARKSNEFNKRVEEKNKFNSEAKCNKILEEKFQVFLERKLKEDKSQKNSQFQKKHNWMSEFKNCIEMIEIGKEFEKEIIHKAKRFFISHLSDRLYNRILVKAQKHIEEEQNRYAYDMEIQEAQADVAKEKQKLQEVLSKYYK